jgi:TatD DNase family protein
MLIDTHAHLYAEEFDEDRSAMIQKASDASVYYILLPNIDVESIPKMEEVAANYLNCIQMMGLHPAYVKEDWEQQLEVMEQKLFQNPKLYCAVGEIGMDLYWDKTFIEAQKIAFRRQVSWAKELGLPIAIHARESFPEILEILDEMNDESLKGVFHCFTGHEQIARHILNYGGFKLGIGGVVTYKNSHLAELLKKIDLEHLVIETDAPYLTPVPFRGKRNESSYVKYVAEKLSDIYQVSVDMIAEVTSKNAIELFQLERFKNK